MEKKEVRFIRFVTGEDVICEMNEFLETGFDFYKVESVTIKNPLRVLYNSGPVPDSVLMAFMPWVFNAVSKTQEFKVSTRDIILVSAPTDEIIETYHDYVKRLLSLRYKAKPLDLSKLADSLSDVFDDDLPMEKEELEELKQTFVKETVPSKKRLN